MTRIPKEVPNPRKGALDRVKGLDDTVPFLSESDLEQLRTPKITAMEKQVIDEAKKEAASHGKPFIKTCSICGLSARFARDHKPEIIFKEFGPFKALDGRSIYLCSICLQDLKGAIFK